MPLGQDGVSTGKTIIKVLLSPHPRSSTLILLLVASVFLYRGAATGEQPRPSKLHEPPRGNAVIISNSVRNLLWPSGLHEGFWSHELHQPRSAMGSIPARSL